IDPYDNWPPRAGEGLFVSGWQYQNRVAALERWSVPANAYRQLSRRFGRPPLVEDTYGAQPARRLVKGAAASRGSAGARLVARDRSALARALRPAVGDVQLRPLRRSFPLGHVPDRR